MPRQAIDANEHFITFAASLEKAIAKYSTVSEESLLKRQKRQVETLVKLEKRFRRALTKHRWGPGIYRDFVKMIVEDKRNILAARPYFRERQNVFTQEISQALKNRNWRALGKFHYNFTFIKWALSIRKWAKGSPLVKLAEQVAAMRCELTEMNMPLAISRARIFWSRTPKAQLSYMDLVQISCEGLMNGIDKFCLPFSASFRAVAIGRITGNLIEDYSIDGNTILLSNEGYKRVVDFRYGDKIYGVNDCGEVVLSDVLNVLDHGELEGLEIEFDNGQKLICTAEHKFLTPYGMQHLRDIILEDMEIYCEPKTEGRWLGESMWYEIPKEKSAFGAQKPMSKVQGFAFGNTNEGCSKTRSQNRVWELGKSVWNDVPQKETFVSTQEGVRCLSSENGRQTCFDYSPVEATTPGCCEGKHEECLFGIQGTGRSQSREKRDTSKESESGCVEMAAGTPRRILFQYGKSMVEGQVFQDGRMASFYRDINLGLCSDSMRAGTKTSGFCKSESQDMGRGGWLVPFYGSIQEWSIGESSRTGRYVKSGSVEASGCYVDSPVHEVFHEWGSSEARMEGVAYSNAPLTDSGSLVLRRVVRVSPVGVRKMYDIEVSHPKHNFFLPSGIVTSNSQTLIHFYPSDKRKIYRANKAISKVTGEDFDKLAEKVNADMGASQLTTPSEIADLVAAASTVSVDGMVAASTANEKHLQQYENTMADESTRPDIAVEQKEASLALYTAIGKLSLFEKKFLKLKGLCYN